MGRALESFQHRFTRRITGIHPKRRGDGGWEYPSLDIEMEEVGFEDMASYVLKRHNMVTQYITTRPILNLCDNMVRRLGEWVDRRWWEQEVFVLAVARLEAAAEADREEWIKVGEEDR